MMLGGKEVAFKRLTLGDMDSNLFDVLDGAESLDVMFARKTPERWNAMAAKLNGILSMLTTSHTEHDFTKEDPSVVTELLQSFFVSHIQPKTKS